MPRLHPADRRAVAAATLAAGLLIAQQVAARAVRDALFLSAFQVKSLPLVMGAAAVAALAGAEAPLGRPRAPLALPRRPGGGRPLRRRSFAGWWAVGLVFPRAAAVGLYLHVAAFGGALVSGFWSLVNERFDPYTARRVVGRIGTGATAGGVAGGVLAWLASRALPLPATVLGLVALSALGAVVLARARSRGGPGHVAARRPRRPAGRRCRPPPQPLPPQHRARRPPRAPSSRPSSTSCSRPRPPAASSPGAPSSAPSPPSTPG